MLQQGNQTDAYISYEILLPENMTFRYASMNIINKNIRTVNILNKDSDTDRIQEKVSGLWPCLCNLSFLNKKFWSWRCFIILLSF